MSSYSKPHIFPPILEALILRDLRTQKEEGLNHVTLSPAVIMMLNKHLDSKGWPRFEYAIMFKWPRLSIQPIHIDGVPPGEPRNASLNLVITGGKSAFFEWYAAKVEDTPLVSTSGIAAFRVDEEHATLLHSEPLQKCSLVKTNVPHRVSNILEDTELLCIRLQGNPQLTDF